jgi:hypothetical protein
LRKVALILIVINFFYSGCSSLRKAENVITQVKGKETDKDLFASVRNKNIGNNNFYIRKAEIFYSENDISKRILASIKYKKPDSLLISFRNLTGFEIARIFVTYDTVLINDRVNKRIIYGDPDNLKKKYGVEADILMIILGDYIDKVTVDSIYDECINGILTKESIVKGRRIVYSIDCSREKAVSTEFTGDNANQRIVIFYRNFIQEKNVNVPGRIVIQDDEQKVQIRIDIKGVDSPWEGKAEFIPGNRYDLIPLQ